MCIRDRVTGVQHMGGTEYIGNTPFHLLSGIDQDGNTWLQLEASPFTKGLTFDEVAYNILMSDDIGRELGFSVDHFFDFLAYKLSGLITDQQQNIGPLGSSKYPESRAIRLPQIQAQQPQLTLGRAAGPRFPAIGGGGGQQNTTRPAEIRSIAPQLNATADPIFYLAQMLLHKKS